MVYKFLSIALAKKPLKNRYLFTLRAIFFLIVATHSDAIAQDEFHKIIVKDKTTPFVLVEVSNRDLSKLLDKKLITFHQQVSRDHYVMKRSEAEAVNNKIYIRGDVNNSWKLAGDWSQIANEFFTVAVTDAQRFEKFIKSISATVTYQHRSSNTFHVRVTRKQDIESIIACDEVIFIKPATPPAVESPNSFQDLSVNKINSVHKFYPELNGEGLTVSVKEKTIDSLDIDFKNRIVQSELADDEISLHANQIATMIAGGGNTLENARGAAWKSNIMSSSYDHVLPDENALLTAYQVSVQNHSYGIGLENFYGAEARAYDINVMEASHILHVFSAGNSGEEISQAGPYAGVEGYANLTGNMKMAKNVLVAGAHYKDMEIDSRNSKGPAYDGRLKPELVAFGPEGTSDAAAVVSGAALLLQDAYKKLHGSMPNVDLIKSAFIVTADDIGSEGIDFVSGYGALNALKAVELIQHNQFQQNAVAQGETKSMVIKLPPAIKKMRIAINWIDSPANINDIQGLTNDLDLQVTSTSTGTVYNPWILSTYAHKDSLAMSAKRGVDRINNTELITIDNPASGSYSINVTGHDIASGSQAYYVTYWLDSAETFRWTYPSNINPLPENTGMYFRWETSYEGNGVVEVSLNGSPFEELVVVSLDNGFYKWQSPATPTIAVARMKVSGVYFYTDTFAISNPIKLNIGFNCDDAVMLTWSPVENAIGYQLFAMGEKYLETLTTVTDTTVIFDKSETMSPIYAVAPLFNSLRGVRSASYDVDNQGVKCYYKTFFAEAIEDVAKLSLDLSSTYRVDRVIWQKEVNGVFNNIGESPVVNTLRLNFLDPSLEGGVSPYRALIYLEDGTVIETDIVYIFYADENTYFVFPNPLKKDTEELEVLTNSDGVAVLFYNSLGTLVKTQNINTALARINMTDLAAGLYFYSILRRNEPVKSGKLILY